MKVENTGNAEMNVTYTYETERTDIKGHFSDGTETVTQAAIFHDDSKKVWPILTGALIPPKEVKKWKKQDNSKLLILLLLITLIAVVV